MYTDTRNSPWWPLELSYRLARGRTKGNYPLHFGTWLRWHVEFIIQGEGFKAP